MQYTFVTDGPFCGVPPRFFYALVVLPLKLFLLSFERIFLISVWVEVAGKRIIFISLVRWWLQVKRFAFTPNLIWFSSSFAALWCTHLLCHDVPPIYPSYHVFLSHLPYLTPISTSLSFSPLLLISISPVTFIRDMKFAWNSIRYFNFYVCEAHKIHSQKANWSLSFCIARSNAIVPFSTV